MSESPQKVIVVTGASRGIGKAIALALAEPGAHIVVNFRSRADEAEEVAAKIRSAGASAEAVGFDVSHPEEIQKAFEKIQETSGGVDVLVNNAGIAMDNLVLRMRDEEWEKTVNANLRGALLCSKAALKTMLRRKNGGRIIYLSSVVGLMGNAGQVVYSATKAGLIGMTKSLAKEVASRDITVNAVAPGFVRTEMTDHLTDAQKEDLLKIVPLRRWAEPEEVAAVVRFLASPDASYITGQVVSVNGGMFL